MVINTRTAVMGLFGMMNWLYTWYNPRVDPDAEVLAREIGDIFLSGIRSGSAPAQSAGAKQIQETLNSRCDASLEELWAA